MDTKTVVISTGIIGTIVTAGLIFWRWMNPKYADFDADFDYDDSEDEFDDPVIVRKDTGEVVMDKTEVQIAIEKALRGMNEENVEKNVMAFEEAWNERHKD